jgi:hypothetical protein
MSTPIPPNAKLKGPDLYAPRRARAQAVDDSERSSLRARQDLQEREQPDAGENEEQTPLAPRAAQAAQERLDDAIRQAIDMARLDREEGAHDTEEEAGDAAISFPPAPNLRMLDGGAAGPTADAYRLDREMARAEQRRRWRLEPDILPEPPLGAERRMALLLLRFALVVGFAAFAAYVVTMIGPLQTVVRPPPHADDNVAETAPVTEVHSITLKKSARLLVQNGQSLANQPVALGISVAGASGDESLLLAGLTAGTRLSAGEPIDATRWQLPLDDLRNVYMYAPKDFVGVMNTAVNLLSPSARLVDSRPVQFAWIAPVPKQPVDRIEPPQKTAPIQPTDRAQEAMLLKRGEDLLAIGDIAGARRVFQYLAGAGNAEAALVLGATFDARFLAQRNAIGVPADEGKARSWYQRAVDLGSTQAKSLLAQTAEK